jgi:hypothetical protein
LCRIRPDIDVIVDNFYSETIGPYWPKEQQLVDDGYRSIPFPFDEIQPLEFHIKLNWNLHDLLAYLRTWSPTKRFIAANGHDPVDMVVEPLSAAWGDPSQEKLVDWPINMRVGRLAEARQ